MHFQQHENMLSVWPPLPNDIHYIEYHVIGSREYDYEFSTNPALVYHVTPLKKGSQHYEIHEDLPNWSIYAFQFAKVYAKSGQLKESIFWLNVSVEAMVEEFIQKIAKNKEMLAELEKDEYNRSGQQDEFLLSALFLVMTLQAEIASHVKHTVRIFQLVKG